MEIINIKKETKTIMTIGMKYVMGYDNYQWQKLEDIITLLEKGESLEKENSIYILGEESNKYTNVTIDLDNKTITNIPSFPTFDFEEVNKDNCCIDLLKKEDGYYAYYDDEGEEIYMPHVSYNDEALLRRKNGTYTFKEIKNINNLVNTLITKEELTDYILNERCVIRLNII